MGRINATDAAAPIILIRILVGWVFLSEGIQKFLFPDALGAGRFEKIGIPAAHVMGPFVGGVEIACGALLLVGLATRLATIPLLIDMAVAIVSTKLPILLSRSLGLFALPKLPKYGFWSMLHEARTDFSMVLSLLFLLTVGAGPCSLDGQADDQTSDREGASRVSLPRGSSKLCGFLMLCDTLSHSNSVIGPEGGNLEEVQQSAARLRGIRAGHLACDACCACAGSHNPAAA